MATGIGRAAGLNAALTDAIAIGHDCGHGPGGHASEEAFDAFLPEGYDHAVWGADVVLVPLNLCAQTLDGIRNHSWARPTPATPEGEVVSWADRIAYCAHDFEDAVQAGVISAAELPDEVAGVCGRSRRDQLATFIGAVVRCVEEEGVVGMAAEPAAALAALRRFNYERIYSRPESVAQSEAVVAVLRALVEHFAARPRALPVEHRPSERRAGPGAGGGRLCRGHDRPVRLHDGASASWPGRRTGCPAGSTSASTDPVSARSQGLGSHGADTRRGWQGEGMSEQTSYVVVGGGLAGAKAAEAIRDADPDGTITLVGAEQRRPYERPDLSKAVIGGKKSPDDLFVHEEGWYAEQLRRPACSACERPGWTASARS